MNIWNLAIKNIKFINKFVILGILFLSISLGSVQSIKYLGDKYVKNAEEEYKKYSNNMEIRVSTIDYRKILSNEIEHIKRIKNVSRVINDYYFSLPLTDEEKNVIFHSKLQTYNKSVHVSGINIVDPTTEGILLPNIVIPIGTEKISLDSYIGKNVFFMIEKLDKDKNVKMEFFQIKVIGTYETNLDENRAPVFVTGDLLQNIISKTGEQNSNILGLQVYANHPGAVEAIASEIEELGLLTSYYSKDLKEIHENLKQISLIINTLLMMLVVLGYIMLFLFFMKNTISRSKELAVLKAMGYSNMQLNFSLLLEMFIYIFTSAMLATLINFALIDTLSKFHIFPFVVSVNFLSLNTLLIFSKILILSFVISLVVLVFPSFKIVYLDPIDYLREE